jgi:predicted glycosyltransferase
MARNGTYNILMYSHDTYGLGHIRRSLAIASHIRAPHINILILTGSHLAGRFDFPQGIDFVRIPGMIKMTNEEYLPLSIKINPGHAMEIRKSIIKTTAKTFQPRLFIIDKEPMGLKKEVLSTLRWIKRSLPHARTVLGLRDIMDDAETIRGDWEARGTYEVLDTLYSEIWVYGNQSFYDPIEEYAIPPSVSRKIQFVGYIPRISPADDSVEEFREEYGISGDRKLVLVTAGGGGDGYGLMDAYLAMLESGPQPPPFQSVLVTGPFMPVERRHNVFARAERMGAIAFLFFRRMEKILSAADLVVSMGGYNTLCETLSQGTVTLVIPRETPRKEQLIRAEIFREQGLVDYLPWRNLTPWGLQEKVYEMLEYPESYREAIARFRMTGIDAMRRRIDTFRGKVSP